MTTKSKSSNQKQTLEEAFRWAKMDIDNRQASAEGREGDYWRGFISGLVLAREFLNRVKYVSLGKGSYHDDDAWRGR